MEEPELTPSELRKERRKKKKLRRLRRSARQAELKNNNKVITIKDLDEDQTKAYLGICQWWNTMKQCGGIAQPLTIGGFAGTGKSTLLSVVIPQLQNGGNPVRVKYCAYMGKAANVLIMKGLTASTIHSLIYEYGDDPRLEIKGLIRGETDPSRLEVLKKNLMRLNTLLETKIPDDNGKIFVLKDPEELDADLIVVDEASQVPDDMRDDLESLRIPVLYTGDHGQLKPVMGKGNIMEDPMFKLETPHRTALDSGIIQMATLVRTGERVLKGIMGKNDDAHKVSKVFVDDLKLMARADMVICYTNRLRASLNKKIREFKNYNGDFPEKGERLICIKNNKQTGMFNGLVLYVEKVKFEDGYLLMDCIDEIGSEHNNLVVSPNYFEGEEHPKMYGRTVIDLFEFAYAITGHKSQGSEWEDVVVIEEKMARTTLEDKRRWLYTALTRASKRLTWVSRFN